MNEESETDLSEWELASTKKMMCYSSGFFISSVIGSVFRTIIFYYYEVEIGLPVILLGLAFVIFGVWNMVNDPLAAYLTDRPFRWTKRWGMRFPWIVIGVIPSLVFYLLLFLSPIADPSNPWPVFWYFIIMSCILDTFLSIYTTHLNAGYTTHFRTQVERNRSSLINNTFPILLGLPLGIMLPYIIVYGKRDTYILAVLITELFLVVYVILLILGTRESDELKERFLRGYATTKKDSFRNTMKEAFQRRSFKVTFLVFLLLTIGSTLASVSGIYFLKDVLRLPLSTVLITGFYGLIGFLIGIFSWAWFSKRFGHAKTMKISLLLSCLAYLPSLWITTLVEAIIFTFLGAIASSCFFISLGPVAADVYDESTVATGKHQEGTYEGMRAFFYRVAFVIVGIVIPVVHILTDYNPDPNAIQTPSAIWGLRILSGLIPSLLSFIAFIIMTVWYDLEGEKIVAIKQKLMEMRL